MRVSHNISIIGRVTLFTAAVSAILCTLLALVVMLAVHRYATGALSSEIRSAGGRVAMTVEDRGGADGPLARQPGRNIQVVDHQGRVVESTPALHGKPPMATFTVDGENTRQEVVCGGVFGTDRCDIVIAQSAHRPEGHWIVYAASPVLPVWVEPWLAALICGAAALLAVAITYLGNRIVSTALQPVCAIRKELNAINASSLSRRVPAPSARDEIHELADSINHTLARLDAAMTQQRQFASDASHDLRSPIAAMRAEVEDALLAPDETSVTTLCNTLMGSLKRLGLIVSDLLTVARLDAGAPAALVPIDLGELAAQECEMRHQTTKTLTCRIEPGVVVLGDRMRLGRLLTNLLDNADRHAESTIMVNVKHEDDELFPAGVALLEVIDDGPGIDPDKRELVFQRFARLDSARTKDAGGSGLGLAIARQIAETRGGSLRIEDSDRGARFVLRLPLHGGHPSGFKPAG
ncbi:sensor histidine kinase [Nonomuraea aridisoli]|uniref:histidine kinase n=1 Tax=Nonomuraea aridisoli TaxID=2070368 RepID=A0A2W2EGS3_9ACTN|nr:HAMP domain-containing sensor histidine kinase [Nonomuraea aridisoli]PZG23476.1 sensor histidine kinase [Nonomuraea aridisoli]